MGIEIESLLTIDLAEMSESKPFDWGDLFFLGLCSIIPLKELLRERG
jgi:hypothetical protein